MTSPARAFVALGSNLGDRRAHLEAALAGLAATPDTRLAAASAAFDNPPVGGPPQGRYLNAVAEVVTTLSPPALHARLRALEDAAGRVRTVKDGPRTLDLDLLSHGDVVQDDPALTLPHPAALTRAFTIGPWAEIAPEVVVPGTGETVLLHAARCLKRDPAAFAALERTGLLRAHGAATPSPRPTVLSTRAALADWRAAAAGTVGFVPTMGALHEGHATLARRAHAACDRVLVSIFVNPLQFGPAEDFSRYPRTLDADLDVLAKEGVDAVFAPSKDEAYPPGFTTTVEVPGPSAGFEGAARPGHFAGVATVVALLMQLARPDRAWFGRKDAQQCAVLTRLATDLALPGAISIAPTVRDADGLALSSRNRYLSADERRRALAIPRSLAAARAAAAAGQRDAARLEAGARRAMEAEGLSVAYAAVVDPDAFVPVARLGDRPALMIAVAKSGTTRLLDNEWMVVP